MDIILLSGLSQAGRAWLWVAVLKDPSEFRVDKWGGRVGRSLLDISLAEN